MDLVSASRGNGHDNLSEHVCEVLWWHVGAVNATLKESVVRLSHTLRN
jgi:hypothetical protein